jgi:hypothetical protein
MSKKSSLSVVLPLIRVARGQRVILDADLAGLYGVSTSRLNQQFRRNQRRFPADFAFVLTPAEAAAQLSQIATASRNRNRRKPPVAYTEYGAVMAANVLNSGRAVAVSVQIVRAFIQLRKIASSHEKIARILAELEEAVTKRLDRHDQEIKILFDTVEALVNADPELPPPRGTGSA